MIRVMKAPNTVPDIRTLKYPLFSSTKYDGNRGLCYGGKLYTSTMRQPRNIRLEAFLKDLLSQRDWVFDYELYSHECSHHAMLSGIINSDAKHLPSDLKCHVFDMMTVEEFKQQSKDTPFFKRYERYSQFEFSSNIIPVAQRICRDPDDVLKFYKEDLDDGYEGSILRSVHGWYKHGRATINQGLIWKLKPFRTYDGVIRAIHPRRENKEGLERSRDPQGYMQQVYSKDSKQDVECVGAFTIVSGDVEFKIGFGPGFTLEDRRNLWLKRKELIGKHVEFRCMEHGSKTAARFGQLIRFREDLDHGP